MPRAYKLIKNGVVTYAPANPKIRQHYEEHNKHLMMFNRGKAAEEMVTVLDASEEEYQQYLAPKIKPKKANAAETVTNENAMLREQLQAMQQQMLAMQSNMLTFLAEKKSSKEVVTDEDKPKRSYTKKQNNETSSSEAETQGNE